MMFNDEMNVHYTVASRISDEEGGGWEFYCQSCGYHARYIVGRNNAFRKLEILDIGNPFVRHSSDAFDLFGNEDDEAGMETHPVQEEIAPDDRYRPGFEPIPAFDESWITPEIRATLEQILAHLDA